MEGHAATDSPDRSALLHRIQNKRRELARYLDESEPRHRRLLNTSIIAGAVAAALTAGPGFGGDEFITAAAAAVPLGVPIWQVLCLAATVFSVAVVIANGLLKSHDLASKISQTRTCDAKLEGLETMLELRQIDVQAAAQRYTQCLAEIPHV